MHFYKKIETEAGPFWAACNDIGITMIARGSLEEFKNAYLKRFGIKPQKGQFPESYVRAIQEAASGRQPNPVPVDLTGLPEFQAKVLRLLQKVPRGEVRTYGELAALAGSPKAVRAVGNTMACNPIPLLIPCHRVVPSSGGVGNFGLGVELKRRLLIREGAFTTETQRHRE
jgi:methylated-DNA-[protein]-cysteine S-methyltransferase